MSEIVHFPKKRPPNDDEVRVLATIPLDDGSSTIDVMVVHGEIHISAKTPAFGFISSIKGADAESLARWLIEAANEVTP